MSKYTAVYYLTLEAENSECAWNAANFIEQVVTDNFKLSSAFVCFELEEVTTGD